MKRAVLFAILLCGCSLRDARNDGASCGAGECHPISSSLSSVSVEVRPANNSLFGVLQAPGIDLRTTLEHSFALTLVYSGTGQVTQLQDAGGAVAVQQASVSFTDHLRAIPGRVPQITVPTDSAGQFAVKLPRGSWDVLVQPSAPLPPFVPSQPFTTTAPLLPLTLPAVGSLVRVQGTLTASSGESLAGATLAAVDAAGNALSAPAVVDSSGGYSLLLPPATEHYLVEVGGSSPINPGASPGPGPSSTLATLPSYDKLAGVPDVVLSLPPVAALTGTVVDSAGTPLPGVAVLARSTADDPWTLARSTVSDASGGFTLQLRAGGYVVEAAPPSGADQPAISPTQTVVLLAGGAALRLVCPASKITRGLQVLMPNGKAAGAGFQITATRLADPLLTTRSATTAPTDARGKSQLTGDGGRYRIEIVAPSGSGLPKLITQIDLDPANDPGQPITVKIPPALQVTGSIHGTLSGAAIDDGPVVGATVSFFATDESGNSVLLGSAATDFFGRYACVLPDVATP